MVYSIKALVVSKTKALVNEDQSTKHPNLENEAPKSRKRRTQDSKTEHPRLENEALKSRKRSTQISKTEHPRLENEAPKPRKRSTQISKPLYVEGLQLLSLAWRRPNQVEATDESAPSKVHQSIPRSIWFRSCRGRAIWIFSWAFPSCHPFV